MDEYLELMADEMATAVSNLESQLKKVRTGRATPKLLENVQVDVKAYGTVMPLNQLATIQAPDARLLVVTPWDKTTLSDVERGIVTSGMGFNPSNDGNLIRIPIAPLTTEKRRELVRDVRRMCEEGKVRVRAVRREYNETFKKGEKDKEISEDELRRLLAQVQEATDARIKEVDELVAKKEKEVLEV